MPTPDEVAANEAQPADRATPYVCPAEHAGWLSTPLRRLVTDPKRILGGLVETGDTVVDLGCGPGFFALPLAEMVGEGGCVVAVDLQAKMLDKLQASAAHKGLAARIRPHRCAADSLGLNGERADFALAFWMVHEVPDAARFFAEVHALLKERARLLLVEPKGHVGKAVFERTVELANAAGLTPSARPHVRFSRAALFERS